MEKRLAQGKKRGGRAEFVEDAKCFIDWLETCGVVVSQSSRYKHYLRIMDKPDDYKLPRYIEKKGISKIQFYYCAELELYIADRIFRAFKGSENDQLKEKLKVIANGPILHILELSSTGQRNSFARNTLFEIYAGAIFSKLGAAVEFGDERYPEPKVSIDGYTVAVQCKRVSGNPRRAIESNIRSAEKQLLLNFDRYKEVRSGMIAVNIDKLVNPLGLVLSTYSSDSRVLLSRASQAYVQIHSIVDHVGKLAKKLDKKIDGILVNCSYVYMQLPDQATGFSNHMIYVARNEAFSNFHHVFPKFREL